MKQTSRQERALLALMLDASVDCIKVIGLDGRLLRMNRSGCLALGVPVDEVAFGMVWVDLLPAEVRAAGRRALRAAGAGRRAAFAGRSELPGCIPVYWDNVLTPIRDACGAVLAILCVSRDISRQREAERRLRIASDFDALTGIANLRQLRRRAARLSARAAAGGAPFGLLNFDIDDFKQINDQGGHDAGDHVLRLLGRRLRRVCRPGELPARLGGDEFAILLDGVSASDLPSIASRVARALAKPIRRHGASYLPTLSIGAAAWSPACSDLSALMRSSDQALYQVKRSGKNGIRVFSGLDEGRRGAATRPRGRPMEVASGAITA